MNNNEIKYIQDNIKATLAIEGLKASNKAVEINKNFLKGKITSIEAIKQIKAQYLKCSILPILPLIKINPNFGEDLYKSIKSPLFYISFFFAIAALVKTLGEEKFKVTKTIGQVLVSALVLFIIYNPMLMVDMGDFIFNFLFGVLKDVEAPTTTGTKVIINALQMVR